jgi:hypothetical protein
MEEITFSPTFTETLQMEEEPVIEIPIEPVIENEELPVEVYEELPEPLEELSPYVPNISSVGLLDGKYLIRY